MAPAGSILLGTASLRPRVAVLAALFSVLAAACGDDPAPREAAGEGPATGDTPPVFRDLAEEKGILFVHRHGGSGEKYLPETMGSGVLAFDYDGDGDVDLYFIQSGALPWSPGRGANVLYRNDGETFVDVSAESGLADDGYGMGGAAADVDNDGDLDVFVTNYGPNRLYVNRGDGTFEDATDAAGVGDPRWGASAAFADYDSDGSVDLYVTNYLDFSLATHKRCGGSGRFQLYCHPDEYPGADDVLYRNRGDGTFEEVTRRALPGPVDERVPERWMSGRMDGKGLGVIWTDYDSDGDPDLYVANDSTRNLLLENLGDGTFAEDVLAGAGLNDEGRTEASMGVDGGDVDGDGWFDFFTVHLEGETNTLYLNNGDGTFSDRTARAGLAGPSLPFVGFGTNFLDVDHDGDLDLFVANGHILDNVSLFRGDIEYAQRDFLFRNLGQGRFADVSLQSGAYFHRKTVGRGTAVADLDGDGDLDVAVANNDGPAAVLFNQRQGGGSVLVHLVGTASNASAIGAVVRLHAGGRWQAREVRSGSSYLSQSDLRVHFGLGGAATVDCLEVRWPAGGLEAFEELPADTLFTIEEGRGITGRTALR